MLAIIGEPTDYDAVAKVIHRRGLTSVYEELLGIVRQVLIKVQKRRHANGSAYVREQIDAGFQRASDWRKTQVGGVDWIKEVELRSGNDVAVAALGVEVQLSGRSVMLYRDVSHLRMSLNNAEIDAGVIVVPNDELARYLVDRCPTLREAIETIKDVRADQVPIRILPIGLDEFVDTPIPKKVTNLGDSSHRRSRR